MATKTRMPKSAGYGATVHTVRMPLWPYAVAPISAIVAFPATWFANRAWADSPGVAVLLTLGAVVIVAFTWRAASARGALMQRMATGVAVAACGWIVAATVLGPMTGWLPVLWLIGGLVLSVVIAVRRVMAEGASGERDQLGDLGDVVKSLKGTRFGAAKVNGAKVTASITREPGDLIGEVADDRERIASMLDVPATAVRVLPADSSERRGQITVVVGDQLREPKPWPGPSRPGGSIADPIELGVMEDSEPLLLWLPGDPAKHRNATHVGVVGMSGAGKTELILRICEEVLTRRDAEIWLGDARKAGQLPRWLLDGAARVATTEPDVDQMLDDLLDDVAARSHQMGAHGHKQWTAGCAKCPKYRLAVFDEAAQVAAGNRVFVDLAESLRSVGISLLVGLQRASHDRFPTSARSNISTWLCLGVLDETDADMALDEDTMKAGAAPWKWKANKPGAVYAEVNGTDRGRWSMPARTFAPPADEDLRAKALAAVRGLLSAAEPARRDEPKPQPAEADEPREPSPPPEDVAPNAAIDPEDPPDDVDPSVPLETPPGLRRVEFDPVGERMTPAQAHDALVAYLHTIAGAGTTRFQAADLGEVLFRTGMSGSWLQKKLVALTLGAHPLLGRPERGWYEIRVADDDAE